MGFNFILKQALQDLPWNGECVQSKGVEEGLAAYIAKQVWDYLDVKDPREA